MTVFYWKAYKVFSSGVRWPVHFRRNGLLFRYTLLLCSPPARLRGDWRVYPAGATPAREVAVLNAVNDETADRANEESDAVVTIRAQLDAITASSLKRISQLIS